MEIKKESQIEFVKLFLTKDWKRIVSILSASEKPNSSTEFFLERSFSEFKNDLDFAESLETPDFRRKLVFFLNIFLKNSDFKIDGKFFNEGITEYFASKYSNKGFENLENVFYTKHTLKIKNFIDKLPIDLQQSFEKTLMDSKILDANNGGGYPGLTRWFENNLGLRISPLVFVDMDFEREDILEKLALLKKE